MLLVSTLNNRCISHRQLENKKANRSRNHQTYLLFYKTSKHYMSKCCSIQSDNESCSDNFVAIKHCWAK